VIVVGIDCHMKTHTAVAVEHATGRAVSELTVCARTKGHVHRLSRSGNRQLNASAAPHRDHPEAGPPAGEDLPRALAGGGI